jgi:hydrogenase expression/formation protein HypC
MCLGVPGLILSVDGEDELLRTGLVDFGGIRKQINLSYVPEADAGDYVIVHVGFAISKLDREAAQTTLEYLDELEQP